MVLKNARMTGNYVRDYEGEFEGSVEKADWDLCEAEYILVIHQGHNVFTVFFEDILLETQLYNYGELGHFWVKGYENLRVMEYQIAILRDKYEYLGEKYCTEYEGKLAMLRDFPAVKLSFLSGSTGEVYCSDGQSMGGNGGSTGSYAGTGNGSRR